MEVFSAIIFCLLLGFGSTAEVDFDYTGDIGNWTVKDCILAQFSLQIDILNNATKTNETAKVQVIKVPATATSSGSCGNNSSPDQVQNLKLKWQGDSESGNETGLSRELTINFGKKPLYYGIQRIAGSIMLANFNYTDSSNKTWNMTSFLDFDSGENYDLMFHVPVGRSYLCSDTGPVKMNTQLYYHNQTGGENWLPTKLALTNATFTHIQFDAFRTKDVVPTGFRTPMDCAYASNDIVPIIVGLALACLVVAVLIAYCIGRRRARQRGYESV